MNKVLLTAFICLTIISLNAQTSGHNPDAAMSSCAQTISIHGDAPGASDLDQHTIASIARCHVQMLDNLQAARWFEKIADLPECNPDYLLEYGQCLKSLKLYGKAKFYFQKYAQSDPVTGNQFMQSCDIAKLMLQSEPMFAVSTLKANTPYAEYAPVMAGGKLIFNSWPSTRQTPGMHTIIGDEASIQPFKGEVEGGMSHLRFSGDGKYVTYASNGFVNGQRLYSETPGTEIYLAEIMSSGKWSKAESMTLSSDVYALGYPSLSANGMEMYFASTMPGGKGGWDIYVINRNGDKWSTPENLGASINTPGNEISPFFTGDILYFSSDWHIGIGGFDVFESTQSGNKWGNVRAVGYPVNSPKDDIDFTWDATQGCAYFSSNRIGGVGSYDLYKAVPQYNEVQINVMNKENMSPLDNASLSITPGGSMAYFTDANGKATVNQPASGEREIVVKKDGYKEQKIKLGLVSNSYQVYLDPVVETVAKTSVIQKEKETKVESKPVVTAPTSKASEKPVQKTVTVQTRMQEMYFIQIAALARQSSLEPYSGLRMYGDLILYDDGTYSKVRVGSFPTEPEAKLVLARVKSGGYPDAFVVKQSVETTPQKTIKSSLVHSSEYKVRLGTYAKVGSFDPSHVMHLGEIESYRKDDLTIMLLGGYTDLTAAKEARDAAATQGFADAYVVMDKGGVFERVR